MLFDEFDTPKKKSTPITAQKVDLKDRLLDMIYNAMGSNHYYCETEQDLVIDESEPENEVNDSEFAYLDDVDDGDEDEHSEEEDQTTGKQETEAEASTKNNNLTVHDYDLRGWSLNKQKEVKVDGFKTSHTWIWKLKNSHRIVSRKITKFSTQSSAKEGNITTNATAKEFVKSYVHHFEGYLPSQIFNTDQSGFKKEIHSGRTLEVAGAKSVERVVQSIPSTTHAYTIHPTISADGVLLSPLFILLQEPDGQFGPRVKANLFQAPNLYVTASASGDLTKAHLLEWFQKVYFTNTLEKSALLLDSWTSYNDQIAIESVKPPGNDLNILRIPPKTTSIIQPLDVYFFRMWKTYVRKLSDRVLLDCLEINLHQRNNILKLQSLVHNQFSSPRFTEFIKYSWFKSGYFSNRPEKFQTPTEFCFNLKDKSCSWEESQCDEGIFVVCAWCKKSFCFNHFFNEFHYCTTYCM